MTSKNKNTNYILSFADGKIVNVSSKSARKGGISKGRNHVISYIGGNNVQVQTGGTNPIVATAKFDPATGTYNDVMDQGRNLGSMDFQTFLTQILRVP